MPKTLTGAPTARPAIISFKPAEVVISTALTVTTPLVISTWYTSGAEPEVVLTATETVLAPFGTVMPKKPPPAPDAQGLATVPRGTGVGSRTVQGADQPAGSAGSAQM